MQYISGFPFMSLEGRRVVVVRILCSGGSLHRGTIPLGVHSSPKPLARLLSFLGTGIWQSGAERSRRQQAAP